MTIIPRRDGVGWGLGPRATWFRRVSTRRRLEWVSVHPTPEASHAPSPAGGRPDGTPRARRVPNKGRGVSESTRRGGDREENPPVPVSFLSHTRAWSPPESLGMRAGSRPLYDVHCSSAENKPLTQLHRTRNNTGHYPSPAARQSWPWRLQGSRQECHRGGVGNPSHFS